MEIKITLQKEDWKKYQNHIEKELPKRQNTWMDSFLVNMLIWAVVAFVFFSIFNQQFQFDWPTALSVSVFFITISALFFFKMYKIRKVFEPSDTGGFCGSHVFTFDESGIVSEGKGYKGNHSWSIVKRIERANGLVLIYLDTVYAFVFPESKLEKPDEFYNFVLEKYSNANDKI